MNKAKSYIKSLLEIFARNPKYILAAATISALFFSVAVLLPNWRLLFEILPSQVATTTQKFNLIIGLFGSIQTNFTPVSAGYTIAIALLTGINISLLTYFIRTRKGFIGGKDAGTGIGGLVSGILGVGCASCGSFILTAALGIFGASGALSVLPFGGEEFGFLGVALLLISSYSLMKKIHEPIVCKI